MPSTSFFMPFSGSQSKGTSSRCPWTSSETHDIYAILYLPSNQRTFVLETSL
jgi:hypothetical protein